MTVYVSGAFRDGFFISRYRVVGAVSVFPMLSPARIKNAGIIGSSEHQGGGSCPEHEKKPGQDGPTKARCPHEQDETTFEKGV